MKGFADSQKWWRAEVKSEIVLSENGVDDLFGMLGDRKARPFFILDSALAEQEKFKRFLKTDSEMMFLFNATDSEPKTGDVDSVVKNVKDKSLNPDVIVGVGGGGTMDLAKAVGICLKNPKPAAEYQKHSLDIEQGVDIWTVPTLSGTGAEITPVAVLRGPGEKLGINTRHAAPRVAIIDPRLSEGAEKINRFFAMMDCYFHHYEISVSKTSEENAILDSLDGLALCRDVLSNDMSEYELETAVKSAKASVLGGSDTTGGRVGASHALSCGLSNASPHLPHSVAVTISMLGLSDLYSGGVYEETLRHLDAQKLPVPKARYYGVGKPDIEKMTKTALGMEKLWLSHFGEEWNETVTEEFLREIYSKIVAA